MAFLPILGAVASAGGALLGGISQANAASYQAQVARNNAKTEQQNAEYAAKATASRTEQEGLRAAQRLSGVEASLAANNIEGTTGSASDVSQSQHAFGLLDTATVANEGALQVYGYKTQANAFDAQAALDQSQVGSDILGGVLGAAGSIGKNAGSLGLGGGGGPTFSADQNWSTLVSGAPSIPASLTWAGGNDTNVDFGF